MLKTVMYSVAEISTEVGIANHIVHMNMSANSIITMKKKMLIIFISHTYMHEINRTKTG